MSRSTTGKSRKTQERIRVLADMMAAGIYVTRDTPRLLASKWGVKPKTVENLASMAAEHVRASIGDDEVLRARLLGTLDRVTSLCMKRATEVWPEGHEKAGELKDRYGYQWLNTLVQAVDRISGLTSLGAPKPARSRSDIPLDEVEALANAVEANTEGTSSASAKRSSRGG